MAISVNFFSRPRASKKFSPRAVTLCGVPFFTKISRPFFPPFSKTLKLSSATLSTYIILQSNNSLLRFISMLLAGLYLFKYHLLHVTNIPALLIHPSSLPLTIMCHATRIVSFNYAFKPDSNGV
jgi:hypothetical protein